MAAFLWLLGRERPTPGAALGLPVGFAGVALLIAPWEFVNGGGVDLTGAIVLMGASASWAAGSLYSRRAPLPASPLLGTAMEMLAGAGVLVAAGTLAGEWSRVDFGSISAASALAVVYLITFGSLIGFTAYIWLLTVSPPTKVSTYAYVNPLVAVILGAILAAEPLTARTLLSVAIILGSVVLITSYRSRVPSREKALV